MHEQSVASAVPVVSNQTELVGTSTMHTLATGEGDQPPQELLMQVIPYDVEDYDPLDSTKYQDALVYLLGRRGLHGGKFDKKSVAADDKQISFGVR